MEEITNRQRLVDAKIMYANADLNEDQENAIASLTEAEVDALISVKEKLDDVFPAQGEPVAPVLFHE